LTELVVLSRGLLGSGLRSCSIDVVGGAGCLLLERVPALAAGV